MNPSTLHRKLLILLGILVAVGAIIVLFSGIGTPDASVILTPSPSPSTADTTELSFGFIKQVATHFLRSAAFILK